MPCVSRRRVVWSQAVVAWRSSHSTGVSMPSGATTAAIPHGRCSGLPRGHPRSELLETPATTAESGRERDPEPRCCGGATGRGPAAVVAALGPLRGVAALQDSGVLLGSRSRSHGSPCVSGSGWQHRRDGTEVRRPVTLPTGGDADQRPVAGVSAEAFRCRWSDSMHRRRLLPRLGSRFGVSWGSCAVSGRFCRRRWTAERCAPAPRAILEPLAAKSRVIVAVRGPAAGLPRLRRAGSVSEAVTARPAGDLAPQRASKLPRQGCSTRPEGAVAVPDRGAHVVVAGDVGVAGADAAAPRCGCR